MGEPGGGARLPRRAVPEVDTLTGQGGETNVERVLTLAPNLVLDCGAVRETYAELANRVEERTRFAYLLTNGRFENTPEALRLPSDILDVPELAEMLAAEAEDLFTRLEAAAAAAPEDAPLHLPRPRAGRARDRHDRLHQHRSSSAKAEVAPAAPVDTSRARTQRRDP